MYNSKIGFRKTFCDKMATKFEVQKGGPKWHLDIWNFTFFTRKMFFKFSLTSVGKIQKSRVFLKSSLLAVYRRPLEWFWDIFLGREICSQSWGIIFRKSTKFPIFENWNFRELELVYCLIHILRPREGSISSICCTSVWFNFKKKIFWVFRPCHSN